MLLTGDILTSAAIRMVTGGIVAKTARGTRACGRKKHLSAARRIFLPLTGRLEVDGKSIDVRFEDAKDILLRKELNYEKT